MTLTSDVVLSRFVNCQECGMNILFEIEASRVRDVESGIVTLSSIHGIPPHILVVHLDTEMRLRGESCISNVQLDTNMVPVDPVTSPLPGHRPETTFGVQKVPFGDMLKRLGRGSVKKFANVLAAVIVGDPVFIISPEYEDARFMAEIIEEVSGAHNIGGVRAMDPDDYESWDENGDFDDMEAWVFDMDGRSFARRPSSATRLLSSIGYIERIVLDAKKQKKFGYLHVRDEVSKLIYSYGRFRTILGGIRGGETITDIELAYEIPTDLWALEFIISLSRIDGYGRLAGKVEMKGLTILQMRL